VVDLTLRLPLSLKIFDGVNRTVVFNKLRDEEHVNLRYCRIDPNESLPKQVIRALRELKIQSLLVEGGAQLLQTFIDEGIWDEARIITNPGVTIKKGIAAPVLRSANMIRHEDAGGDLIQYYTNLSHFVK
jgi:diaminohydroxyphosphoribosylaminopyrimidine deaminase/5-amino-6-(5-phosphoribosylamino)uracil reductase